MLRKAVIEAKIALSAKEATTLVSRGRCPMGKQYRREITREQFEGLIAPVIARTAGPVKQALKDAGLTPEADRRSGDGGWIDADSGGARAGVGALRSGDARTDAAYGAESG